MQNLVRVDEGNLDFLRLVAELDDELRLRDGDEHDFYARFNKPAGLSGVVVVYLDDVAVGCGAFKRFDRATAEVKRMFVQRAARGKRVGGAILAELEAWAGELGFTACLLETGLKQPEAIALYTRESYQIIPNYGQYAGVENSVCMKKVLGPQAR